MAKTQTYDERCYELAGWFLSDHPKISNADNRHALALVIQQAIEDEIESIHAGLRYPTEESK
jgi:hypothetical protein